VNERRVSRIAATSPLFDRHEQSVIRQPGDIFSAESLIFLVNRSRGRFEADESSFEQVQFPGNKAPIVHFASFKVRYFNQIIRV